MTTNNLAFSPLLHPDDLVNMGCGYPVLFRQFVRRYFSGDVALSDFVNLIFRQFRKFSVSCLAHHIKNIIRSCSKKQMGWIDANSVIAFMQNVEPFRDKTISQLPRHAMSPQFNIMIDAYLPISISSFAGFPYPAIFSLFDFRPKSFNQRYLSGCHKNILYENTRHTAIISLRSETCQ